jgi:hypothetical protein
MKPISIETALINLYNNTRKAPLTLDEHDNNRVYLDVLSQALSMKLEWSTPAPDLNVEEKQVDPNAPKQADIIGITTGKKKR